jgi:hypothetical protein
MHLNVKVALLNSLSSIASITVADVEACFATIVQCRGWFCGAKEIKL